MLPAVQLFLLWLLPCISASWKDEHVVTGLPTLNGPDLTSYAGVVPVRKDYDRHIEVVPHRTCPLTCRVGFSTGCLKPRSPYKNTRL